jgi:hypothetical protein
MVPDDPVQYAFPLAATAIAIGCFWLVASGVGVPAHPLVAHDMTLPPLAPTPMFTQYTVVPLTVMPVGPLWLLASTVGLLLQPVSAHALTVPPTWSTQYAFALSIAMS